MGLLTVNNISVRKTNIAVVDDISLSITSGSFVALLGPNGAGKTTLLRTIAGLEPLAQGDLQFDGCPLATMPSLERSRILCWCPEYKEVPFSYRVLDLAVLGRFPWHQGLPTLHDYRKAEAALVSVGLGNKKDWALGKLSSGEKRRASIARALCGEHRVLLFDEPTANLDISYTLKIFAHLKYIAISENKIILASLHDLSLVSRFATQSVLLHSGKKIADCAPPDLDRTLVERAFGVKAQALVHDKHLNWYFSS